MDNETERHSHTSPRLKDFVNRSEKILKTRYYCNTNCSPGQQNQYLHYFRYVQKVIYLALRLLTALSNSLSHSRPF